MDKQRGISPFCLKKRKQAVTGGSFAGDGLRKEEKTSVFSLIKKQASSLLGGCLSNLLQSLRACSGKGKVHS